MTKRRSKINSTFFLDIIGEDKVDKKKYKKTDKYKPNDYFM